MNRQMMITGIVFIVAGAITIALLKWVIYVPGVWPKLIIGLVVALVAGAIAFFVTRNPAAAK